MFSLIQPSLDGFAVFFIVPNKGKYEIPGWFTIQPYRPGLMGGIIGQHSQRGNKLIKNLSRFG
jgi:hypothetical protein